MVVRILLRASALARCRFAVSPAAEVIGTLSHARHPAQHARRWSERAASRLSPATLALLRALVPDDHPYSMDFLLPIPAGSHETMASAAERIARTPEDLVEYHLDIGLAGRAVRGDVANHFGDEGMYRAWRRPVPDVLAGVIARGPRAVAEAAAEVMAAFYQAAVAEDWPRVLSVLDADVEYRGALMVTRGAGSLLGSLGRGLSWTGSELRLERSWEGQVECVDEGVVFLPSTAHHGSVAYTAEQQDPLILMYQARGIARLWDRGTHPAEADPNETLRTDRSARAALADLVGPSRLALLLALDEPRSTRDLSLAGIATTATVSYHLGILARSALVTKARQGRRVLYRRTALAERLLQGRMGTAEGLAQGRPGL